ncbi:hypothetical protein ASD12_21710 [Mesorhizobium sp. Root102]|uniref:phosphatase PAP2 family protein n=1 Tax=Mesorhizobium sp. Root102 TaxID=1736422 RepID=UPI0007128667|nr:phosphatase PAP2 family protein [Mesorhizobium sp. Root102]KQU97041.1 hypothetical protein ASD12_21710 [Mesorhizobium sp. Root102]
MRVIEAVMRWGSPAIWRANNQFYATLVVYLLFVIPVALYWQIPIDVRLYNEGFWVFGFSVAVVLFSWISIRVMLGRPGYVFSAIKEKLLENELAERIMKGLPVILVLPVFFSIFTSMKDGINRIVPFYADKAMMEIDRSLHGGFDAWQILPQIFRHGALVFVLNFFYNLWFVIMFVVLFCVAFSSGNDRLRSQYLVAFVLTWGLLGNLAATAFSSVGPAFVLPFYGDRTFSPLMEYLNATNAVYPIWALYAQGMLLANAALDGPRMGSGISAFPSLHVAIATLNAIYLWRFGGLVRWTGVVFLIATQIGSVQLAWHYGIDGYASMLATPIIWIVAGRIAKPWPSSTPIDIPFYRQ